MPLWLRHLLLLSVIVGLCLVVYAQQASPLLTCEAQVAAETRQLAAYLPQTSPLPTWQAQLEAMVAQVRMLTTRLDLKRNQVDQAETSLAQLLEQVRQLQQRNTQLLQELEVARTAAPPPSN